MGYWWGVPTYAWVRPGKTRSTCAYQLFSHRVGLFIKSFIEMTVFPLSYNLLSNSNLCVLFSIQLPIVEELLAADTRQQMHQKTKKLRTSTSGQRKWYQTCLPTITY